MTDHWMDQVRWSYLHGVRLMALQYGLILVQSPDTEPEAEMEGYLTAEWNGQDDESCLFTLVEQSTGEDLFPDGVTLGEIEDYLATCAQR